MSFKRLNQWLTLIANLGVLLGIIFLVIEINQNTEAIRIESAIAEFSATDAAFGPAAYQSDVTDILVRVGQFIDENGIENFDRFYNTDHRQFQNIVQRRIEYLEFRYIAYPQEREQLMALTNELLRQLGFLEIFNYFPYDVTTPGFGQFIKSIIEELAEV